MGKYSHKDPEGVKLAAALTEKRSLLRLIIQRPTDGAVLLRRYPSDADSSDTRYFRDTDADGVSSGLAPVVDNYWSFKGLSEFRLLGGETQLAEPIKRLAYRQIGITIENLSLVMVVKKSQSELPERIYVHTRDWSGDLLDSCDPGVIPEHGDSCSCQHEWVDARFLSCYLYHPEVIAAVRASEGRVGLVKYARMSAT